MAFFRRVGLINETRRWRRIIQGIQELRQRPQGLAPFLIIKGEGRGAAQQETGRGFTAEPDAAEFPVLPVPVGDDLEEPRMEGADIAEDVVAAFTDETA